MNQSPTLENYNAFDMNLPLKEALAREGGGWAEERCRALGEIVGSAEGKAHAARADARPPVLRRYDGYGNPINIVERDPSWHWLVDKTVEFDLHAMTRRDGLPPAHAARAAMILSWGELSLPTVCPVSANYAIVPALEAGPALKDKWIAALTTRDKSQLRFAAASMTERQGGSDIRGTTTRAERLSDGTYAITGQKWFVTCPWADILLVLAQAPEGLTCFLIETADPGYRIENLKDKLGWHALGVGEVELHGVIGHRLGDEGRGVGVIMRMISFTRLDVMLECAASIRMGTMRAVHHTRYRQVLGRPLRDHAAMKNVLADLAIESEATTAAAMRVARSFDEPSSRIGRLALTLMKYWFSKRASGHAAEALECLGGNGFVEASGMPRLLRDSIVGSVWEGSGNVAALDILRAIGREPEALEEFIAECNLAKGGNSHYDKWIDGMSDYIFSVVASNDSEWEARKLVQRMALSFQAGLLIRFAPPPVSDAFCAGRLAEFGPVYGCLPKGIDTKSILERALPE